MNYEYLDVKALDSYLSQTRPRPTSRFFTKVSFEFTLPLVKFAVDKDNMDDQDDLTKLSTLLKLLAKSGQIIDGFPLSHVNCGFDGFYFCSGRGTKYRLPKAILDLVDFEADVFLWLVEQDHQPQSGTSAGDFVFLLERVDNSLMRFSTFSATQLLMSQLGFIVTDAGPHDHGSPDAARSPHDLLAEIGAEAHSSRTVSACCRCRPTRDAMLIPVGGERRRFDRLFAYALFIASR